MLNQYPALIKKMESWIISGLSLKNSSSKPSKSLAKGTGNKKTTKLL
jgi:hypothetical protein